MSLLTERCLEKFGKKLIERTDIEDALKRLEMLTQEEARMAVAQNLKATHTVDERVRGVADMVVAIDNRVAGVDDRVAGLDGRLAKVDDGVARIGDRMALVDDKVAGVDDKVASVDDKVASIDNIVKSIDATVASVDDRVVIVDDKVAVVIQGTQIAFSQACDLFNLKRSDGREANQVIKQTANDVDLVKRASYPDIFIAETTVSCR